MLPLPPAEHLPLKKKEKKRNSFAVLAVKISPPLSLVCEYGCSSVCSVSLCEVVYLKWLDIVHGEISLGVILGLSAQRLHAQGAQWTGCLPREGGREGRGGVDGRREGGRQGRKVREWVSKGGMGNWGGRSRGVMECSGLERQANWNQVWGVERRAGSSGFARPAEHSETFSRPQEVARWLLSSCVLLHFPGQTSLQPGVRCRQNNSHTSLRGGGRGTCRFASVADGCLKSLLCI